MEFGKVGVVKRTFFFSFIEIVEAIRSASLFLSTGSVKQIPPLKIFNFGVIRGTNGLAGVRGLIGVLIERGLKFRGNEDFGGGKP